MVSASDAEALRRAQAGIRVLVLRDLEDFWRSLDLSRPERARDALLAYIPELVAQYGLDAGVFAADWYDVQRAAAGIPGAFVAAALPSPYADAVDGMVRRAAGDLFTDNPSGSLLTLRANTAKYVLAASRTTISRNADRDPRSSGWRRVTRGGGCDFCRMLAGRGGVYKESTVHFASHGDCNCAAVPSWDQSAPEVDVRLYQASQRTTTMTPRQRAWHNATIQ